VASRVFGVKREEILDKGSRRDKARKVAISICQQYTGLSNGAIGDTLSGEYGRTWVTPFSPLGL
jgi:chromosomal replication initiation ATPase DnaA